MIVFLDIDGVVLPDGVLEKANVSVRRLLEDPDAHFDMLVAGHSPAAVEHVKTLVEKTGAKLVVHSSWRRVFGEDYTLRFLDAIGLTRNLFHVDHTCEFRFSSSKASDIGLWLSDHPDELKVIIIDDDFINIYGDGRVNIRQIMPKSYLGLLTSDLDQLGGDYFATFDATVDNVCKGE